MNFTFGICVGTGEHLLDVINSIISLNIPKYEIILVGDRNNMNVPQSSNIKIIDFNESVRPMWITRKKNIITNEATYENIVYLHDYIKFDADWYQGFLDFGDNFQICMNKIKNANGERFRDWVMYPAHHTHANTEYGRRAKAIWEYSKIENNESMLPYNETRLTKYQYISGSYWVAKKHVMQEFPLNEGLSWGGGEDIEWSMRVLKKYNPSMNANSSVHFCKQKRDAFGLIRDEQLRRCVEFVQNNG